MSTTGNPLSIWKLIQNDVRRHLAWAVKCFSMRFPTRDANRVCAGQGDPAGKPFGAMLRPLVR